MALASLLARFHYLGYGVWALALAHGLLVGTDTPSPYALAVYATSAASVAGVAWWRWFEVVPKSKSRAKPVRVAAKPAAVERSEGAIEREAA